MKKRLAKIADQTAARAQPELACALIATTASIYSPQKLAVPLVPPNSIETMLMFVPTVARTAELVPMSLACAQIVTTALTYSPQKPAVPPVPPNSIVTMLMFAQTVARTAKRAQQEMVFVQNAIQTLNSSKISTILVRHLARVHSTALLTKLARIAVLTAIHVMIRLELAHSVEMALNYTQTTLV